MKEEYAKRHKREYLRRICFDYGQIEIVYDDYIFFLAVISMPIYTLLSIFCDSCRSFDIPVSGWSNSLFLFWRFLYVKCLPEAYSHFQEIDEYEDLGRQEEREKND